MDYQKIYNCLIERAITDNRKKCDIVYYEQHHIIPKCLGGTDNTDNLVLLTAREHFIAHRPRFTHRRRIGHCTTCIVCRWVQRRRWSIGVH